MEMTNIQATLVDVLDPGDPRYKAPLPLTIANGYVPQTLTIGFPEVREVTDKRPNANGTFDNTKFYGAGAVQLTIGLASELAVGQNVDDEDLLDQLKAWMPPSRRTWLHYRFKEAKPWRRIQLRTTNTSRPYNLVKHNAFGIASLAWKSVEGTAEGVEQVEIELTPGGGSGEAGRAYDLNFDRVYPFSLPVGVALRFVEGTLEVLPTIRIFGPCTQPRIQNITTGKRFEFFPSFSILAGEWLDVNFKEGTVLLNGLVNQDRYNQVDFSVSEWWELLPEENLLQFYPLSFSAPSVAKLYYHPQFL